MLLYTDVVGSAVQVRSETVGSVLLVERCSPVSVQGRDPSEEQLAYARTRPASRVAQFRQGDAMVLPFADDMFDAAVMPPVISFVPDPAKGVAEMARVVRPGGLVAAYAWDMLDGGFPDEMLYEELRGRGIAVPAPPSPDASRTDALRDFWTGVGLVDVETGEIVVQRTFSDFNDYWSTVLGGPSVGRQLAAMALEDARISQSDPPRAIASGCDWPYHLRSPGQRSARQALTPVSGGSFAAVVRRCDHERRS
jgi:SAM-dependent methyltransferase